jgi:hypothetical protein
MGKDAPVADPAGAESGGVARLGELFTNYGIDTRGPRGVVALLTERPRELAELVGESGLPRRAVQELLAAVQPDLVESPDGVRLAESEVPAYRALIDYAALYRTALADPLLRREPERARLAADLSELIDAAPRARAALDHVSATPDTVARRALWLDSRYDLAGAHVVCVGDHDLTSLAIATVSARVRVSVIDVDDNLMAYLDRVAAGRSLDLRCYFADLRFGLPPGLLESADLIVTDPPYTPIGVELFLARGLQLLRDHLRGRLVLAYGFSDLQPMLGLKVQAGLHHLQLVYEEILPRFNRYRAAQAIGSASDQYLLRPTSKSRRIAERVVADPPEAIYTHGQNSLEGHRDGLADDVAEAIYQAGRNIGAAPDRPSGPILIGPRWPAAMRQLPGMRLATLLSTGLPSASADSGASIDLSADSGSLLLRVLLAGNAARLAVLLPSGHPDLAGNRAELAELIGPKYVLRARPAPDARYVILEADPSSATNDADRLVGQVLHRAHGKIANVWRDALIATSRTADGPVLTKNEARALVADASVGPPPDCRLLDLPRHALAPLLAQLRDAAARLTADVH